MSAEPGRKKAYQAALRWRVVYQKVGMNLSFKRIARNLNIAISTAHGIYKLFERTGKADPSTRSTREELRKLNKQNELTLSD